jgi:riboflavin biosynthesis pyrimidine reductase
VAVDPHGKLRWDDRVISDSDEGYDGAHIIEVLTEQVSDAFLEHLRLKGVSYIFAGKDKLDLERAAQKLTGLFGIDKLLLEGGGIVNDSFLIAGLVDKISLVIISVAETSEQAIPLFKISKYTSTNARSAAFQLKAAEKLDNGGLWLTYRKN